MIRAQRANHPFTCARAKKRPRRFRKGRRVSINNQRNRRILHASTTEDRAPARRGYTLIEVLLAIALLSASTIAIMGAFQTCTSALAVSRDRMRATHLLKEKLGEFERGELAGATGGECAGDDYGLVWGLDLRPVVFKSGAAGTELKASVWRKGDAKVFSLTTYAREERTAE